MTRHPASESGRLSAAELYENARAEQALVLSIGGPTAPWEEPELFTTEIRAAFKPLR